MTIPDEEHDRLYRTEREQAATIARLERALVVANVTNDRLANELSTVRGAMAADDERLRLAAERVGIVAGCDAPDEMADRIEELRDWVRSANGFAWSHERSCPRYADREAECTCGLHQFLSRPRPYVESLKAKAEALDALGAWISVPEPREAQLCMGVSGRVFGAVMCRNDGYDEGKATTLASAIMDALKKAG